MSVVRAMVAAGALLVVALAPTPPAHADGLSSCTESPDKLNTMAQKTIDIIQEKVPLGPYETAGTVLQFVNKSLSGVTIQTPCADIMAIDATQRINGDHQRADRARTQLARGYDLV